MKSKIPSWLWGTTCAVYDIETDEIKNGTTTKIFCIGVGILSISNEGIPSYSPSIAFTNEWVSYSTGSLQEALVLINSCNYSCGHGIMAFDQVAILKHLGSPVTAIPLDTIILSKIIISKDELFTIDALLKIDKNLWGKYSLKAFGQRLRDAKIDFTDFSELTEEMVIYMNQDVDVTYKLLLNLLERDNFPLKNVVEIEHKTAAIIAEQTEFGFYIDIEKTKKLNTELLQEKGELSRKLLDIFSPKFLKDSPVKTYKKITNTRKYIPNKKWIKIW